MRKMRKVKAKNHCDFLTRVINYTCVESFSSKIFDRFDKKGKRLQIEN